MQLSLISLALTKVYGGVAAFSPSSLFASSEQGVWYDPSDLTTMFQDATGTTPVTADGQPVGLILDKHVSSFAVQRSTSGWTKTAGDGAVSVVGNLITISGATTTTDVTIPGGIMTFPARSTLQVTCTDLGSAISPLAYCAGSPVLLSFGISTEIVSSQESAYTLVRISSGSATFLIEEITQWVGNHASQATAARRPLYKTDGTYHWLQFDGVDDSLATANITLNTSQAVTFFSGIHGSGTAQQVLTELGPTHDTTFPAFCCFYPNTSAQYAMVQEQDAIGYSSIATGNGITATKNTFSFAVNIGATRIDGKVPWYRINGVTTNQETNASPVASGGTFAVTPLYIAARAGTSRFFKDKIYSYVLLNRLATTDEIAATETWVNQRTGAF